MFKYFISALVFLLLLIFGMMYILGCFKDDDEDDENDKEDLKQRNDYFKTMTELEARMMDVEILSKFFDGVIFQKFEVFEDAIINTYFFVDANDGTYNAFIKNQKIERLQERIKADLVNYLDRNYSLRVAPGFTFKDYIEVDASVYRRVLIKRVTAL